jgi:hypothetical protein
VCGLCIQHLRTSHFFQEEVKRSLEVLRHEFAPIIKQEVSETPIAVILSPRTLAEEQFHEDMLEEIHNISNPNTTMNESDQEIIDYEPELENFVMSGNAVPTSSPNRHECRICKKIFHNAKALVSHYRYHRSDNNCLHCEKKFLNSTQLKLHVRAKHPEYYQDFRLGYQKALVSLSRMDSFNECNQCLKIFSSIEALHLHHGVSFINI